MTFEEWVEAQEHDVFLDYSSAAVGWEAAQKAERERIKDIIKDVASGGWIRCCNAILERIDSER